MEEKNEKYRRINVASRNNRGCYSWNSGCFGWPYFIESKISIIREAMKPNTAESRHYHTVSQQFFYIISGKAIFELEGKQYHLGKDEGIQILPKQVHCIQNNSLDDLNFLVISTPPTDKDRINVNIQNQ